MPLDIFLYQQPLLTIFQGHKAQVSSIEVNPVDKTFLSSSYDGTVKLWDLKSSSAVGNLEVGQNSVIRFDPHGVVLLLGNILKVKQEQCPYMT